MQVRTIYTDERCPDVELWESDSGLIVRNGKKGRPVVLNCPKEHYETQAMIADAFFKGLAYHDER